MRKLLISLLLASAAVTPALADPPTREERQQAREERQQARESRQQSRDNARAERPQKNGVERAQPEMRIQPQMEVRQQTFDRTPRMQTLQRNENVETARERVAARQQAAQDRRDQREERAELRRDRTVPPVRTRPPVVSQVPRPGTQPPARVDTRHSSAPQWNTNWRHDKKYDWYNYRHHHRSLFHLGFYFDPFGWGYQPWQIGWRLWPSYYSSRYWITDPWMYRLPYAPPGYVWIRYWNDAVLVDTWTGEVVDVIYNFFW